MKTRTVTSEVAFTYPFIIGDHDEEIPAGTYTIDSDEEKKGKLLFSNYQPVRIVMHLPTQFGGDLQNRTLTVTPGDLKAALKRDKRAPEPETVSVSAGYTP